MDMATGAVVELESTHDNWARPGLSPDGSRIAFGNHVVDADGSNLQQIAPADLFTDEQFGVFSAGLAPPQWSPDGSLIAFASFNDHGSAERQLPALMEIYVVRPDGSGLQRLTTDTDRTARQERGWATSAPNFPTWTRDGRIAFIRYPARERGPSLSCGSWTPTAANATRLEVRRMRPALTALGLRLVPVSGKDVPRGRRPVLCLLDPGVDERKATRSSARCVLALAACEWRTVELLLGRRPIATEAVPSAAPSASVDRALPRLVPRPHQPCWLDEPWIAYQWEPEHGQGLYLMRPDGSDAHEIATELPADAFHPDWSPDGKRIALDPEPMKHEIWVVDADGTNAAAIVHTEYRLRDQLR